MSFAPGRPLDQPVVPRATLMLALLVAVISVGLLGVALLASLEQAVAEADARTVVSARVVERGLTRTLESAELTLVTIAQEIRADMGGGLDLTRRRIREAIRFAPQLRQVVLLKGDRVLVDSNGREGVEIDVAALDLPPPGSGGLNLGLRIGGAVPSRFLPLKGQTATAAERSLVPVAVNVDQGGDLVLVAALNASYLAGFFEDVGPGERGRWGLFRIAGDPLVSSREVLRPGTSLADVAASSGDEAFTRTLAVASSATRLSARYPLGVVIQVSHRDVLDGWGGRNRIMVWVLTGATLMLLAAIVLLVRDTMQRVALQNQVRLLFQAIEQSPMVVLITDANGVIDYANPAVRPLLGYAPEELIGANPRIFNSGATPPETYRDLWQCISSGAAWTGEFVNRRKDGETLAVSSTISAVRDASGRVTHYIGVMNDITAVREAKLEQERLIAKLSRANADLQRFAEVSAHHLQEPARRLVSFAQILRKHVEAGNAGETASTLDFIEMQARRLRELLRDVQLYLAAGQGDADPAVADAASAVKGALERLSPGRAVVETGALPPVRVDPQRLTDIFAILIGNAVEHACPGGEVVVRIWGESDGETARYMVADDGIGIPAEYRERVFRVFERLQVESGVAGTGIGLAIVRRIVENRDGKVWIEDTPGGGTTVVFRVPSGEGPE
ncbi:ATP-binding protein [Magnetospirillum sp. UT-4]|uniref:sensor histidine kinase n=1 Tax=Magnetospirillum sp. UT-4 TaxID=2681467 RepID=UPI00137F00A1|nr:ATP-binding protein [Magnetospirillum sp. UT-4]CAA7615253.1 putative Histidine kinase [Magnetospirillum sp. UT-4]